MENPNTKPLRIVIVDDLQLIRVALRNILGDAGYDIVGEAANAADGIKLIAETHPDVVVLDYNLGKHTGMDVYRALERQGSTAKVVLLTSIADVHVLSKLIFDTEISAVVSKAHQKYLLDAVAAVVNGDTYIDASILSVVVRYRRLLKDLSSKHADIIYWMSKGLNNDSISEKMDLGVRTISNYRSKIRTQIKNDALKQISAMISGSTISDSCS